MCSPMNKLQLWRWPGTSCLLNQVEGNRVKWERSEAGEADCDCSLSTWMLDNFNIEMQLIHSDL